MRQSFVVPRTVQQALDDAETYLVGAGKISPPLAGRLERVGTQLAVHHGRIRTTVTASATPSATHVDLTRVGQAPLEDTRKVILSLGLGGFLLALGLSLYNDRASAGLPPLVTLAVFFVGVVLVLGVLFVADRSLERRSESLVRSLEDAMQGAPLDVLRREIHALERSTALANGLIFYCAALIVEFLIFIIVLSDGIRDGINEVAALDAMRYGLLIPILPALLFAGAYFFWANRVHGARLQQM